MKWFLNCRETSELVSRAQDQDLPFSGRMAMRLHLAICENCARFAHQLQEMRRQFRVEIAADDDAAGLPPEARQRIEQELQKKVGS